jgi:hypothetical protein
MKGKKILTWKALLRDGFQAANELARANGYPEYRPVWTCTGQGTFSNPYSVI